MKVSPRSAGFVALGLVVGLLLGGIGVATATSGGGGTKACASKKGVLVLPSAKGKCPAKSRSVTLGAKGPAGPAGTTYLLSGPVSISIGADTCGFEIANVPGLAVGDTAIIVPDYAGGFPAAVQVVPGVVKVADQLPLSVCNIGPAQSLSNETFYAWRVRK